MYTYDVALSFAGEDREIVREIAKKLKAKKLKVFYDEFEETNLLGKDLYQYLHYIYKEAALFCVIFISSNYMKKVWSKHELQAAQNRAFVENREYILPLQLESNIQIPGLADTIGYLDVNKYTTTQIVKMIYDKVYTIKPKKEHDLLRKKRCMT